MAFGSPTTAGFLGGPVDRTKIMYAHFEPSLRLLVEIQSPADLDDPAVVETDLAIVQIGMELHFQNDIQLQQTLL
jgi:hypothetical protein